MNWFELMKKLKEKSGMTNHDIAIKSGVPEPTLEKIFSGATKKPGINTVIDIIHALGGTMDMIDPAASNNQSKLNYALSSDEIQLIKKYRALDEHGKESVQIVIDREAFRVAQLENAQREMEAAEDFTPTLILLPRSEQPASAGTGMFLEPDGFETIYVRDNPLVRRASFAVPVRGDSMEPEYHDGDTLLVQAMNDIRVGEIGVFTLDGQGYVKERGETELISINPEYDPIPMNGSIRCNGKVIGVLDPEWIVEE